MVVVVVTMVVGVWLGWGAGCQPVHSAGRAWNGELQSCALHSTLNITKGG